MNPYSPDPPAGPPDGPLSDPLIGSHLVRLPMTALAAYTLGMVNPGRSPVQGHPPRGHVLSIYRDSWRYPSVQSRRTPGRNRGLPAPSLTRQPSEGAYCHQRRCCRVIESRKDSK